MPDKLKPSEYRPFKKGFRQFLFQSTDEMLDEASCIFMLDAGEQGSCFENFDAEPRNVLTRSDVERMGLPEWLAQQGE